MNQKTKSPLRMMIKKYCQIYNQSQNYLADEIGLNHASMSRFVNGESLNEANMLKIINWLFGVSK